VFNGPVTVDGSGNLSVTSATAKSTSHPLTHASIGTTVLSGKFSSTSSITVNAGSLTLGDPAVAVGFSTTGPVVLNGGSLTARSASFVSISDLQLNGGTLHTPGGFAVPMGALAQGKGAINGRVSSSNGSAVRASTGNLTLGDAAHPAGVNLDGELYVEGFQVTLNDLNQAVLGSYTSLGDTDGAPGTLTAPNGIVLNFGRNVVGYGSVVSTNTLSKAVLVNGDVSGTSLTQFLDFTGYVKGVGTFNNVAFSGTFSPGLSPAIVHVGNVIYSGSNVLEMEIGGLNRGGDYDAIISSGVMSLGGQLQLTLINGFVPAAGNSFDLFDGAMAGTFSSFNFPPLTAGLFWNTSQLYTQGIVEVSLIPEPTALASLAFAAALLRRRR
jgi:hypothetical protein